MKSHPAQQLTLNFLPKMLVRVCHDLVVNHAKLQGYTSVVNHLWHKDTNAFIAIHKDLFAFLHNAVLLWRVRNFCFVLALALLAMSFLINGWIAFGLIPMFIITRHLTKRMNSYYSLIAGLMLALEIAGNDFGGWVTDLPDVHLTANDRLARYMPHPQARFLDFYMPNRAQLSQSDLVDFAAMIKTDFDQGHAEFTKKVEAIFAE
jgi:hypothetical protein